MQGVEQYERKQMGGKLRHGLSKAKAMGARAVGIGDGRSNYSKRQHAHKERMAAFQAGGHGAYLGMAEKQRQEGNKGAIKQEKPPKASADLATKMRYERSVALGKEMAQKIPNRPNS